ncbi:MAG: DNA methyltransferase, partial [bacterium]
PAIGQRCVLAATSATGAGGSCGAPGSRLPERPAGRWNPAAGGRRAIATAGAITGGSEKCTLSSVVASISTVGWETLCKCDAGDPVPCVVLDPFAGSGTTGLVADRLGRDSILIDASAKYCEMARTRIDSDAPLLMEIEAAEDEAVQLEFVE